MPAGTVVVMATHDLDLVRQTPYRTIELREGAVVFDSAVDEAEADGGLVRLLTREALLSFRRAPLLSALSITTIAFSLFTVGLFGLVAINLRQALRGIEERVEIVAFVLRGTPAETITLATQDIAAFPEVQDVSVRDRGAGPDAGAHGAGGVPRRVPRPRRRIRSPRPSRSGSRRATATPRRSSAWPSGCGGSASWTTCGTAGTGCSGWTSFAT